MLATTRRSIFIAVLATATICPIIPPAKADLLISSAHNNSILRYDQNTGEFLGALVPDGEGGLNLPEQLAFGPDGDLYVDSFNTNSVLRYTATGAFLDDFVAPGSGGLIGPHGLLFGPDGNLYVTYNPGTEPPQSGSPSGVKRYSGATGAFIDNFVAAGQVVRADHAVFGPDGNLYVISGDDNSVLRFNGATGAFMNTFVSSGSGGLDAPIDLVFGPDGNLYVTSYLNDSVLRYNGSTGAFMGDFVSCGSGGLDGPFDLAFGPDGNLYVISHEQLATPSCAVQRPAANSSVLRYNGTTGAFMDVFVAPGSGGLSGATALVFTTPEPGSLIFAVGGLGVLIFAKYRRRISGALFIRSTNSRGGPAPARSLRTAL
jgi:DNA-binding beta-propeller fold protein YncE